MERRRMYLFERAYKDYIFVIRKYISKLLNICGKIWNWFWKGTGADAIEVILRILVVVTTIVLCVLYIRYELSQGRSFSIGTFFVILILGAWTLLVLWAWKAPIHFAARAVSGSLASGSILIISLAAILIAIVFFTLYLLVLFILTALSFIIFVPMRFLHWLWLQYRRIAYRCPYDDCAYHGLPIHICECGHRYDDLKPSFYGIFHHVCLHPNGKKIKLPTMDFLGRKKLPRLCGGCKRPLIFSSLGELPEWPIAMIGGPSVGKTIFLRQAIRQLCERLGTKKGITIRIDSDIQERELRKDFGILDRGQVLAKTAGDVMQAFGLAVNIRKQLRCLLYLFDAPGEDFIKMDRFGQKQVIQHITGIILLVDPFSLPLLINQDQFENNELKASQTPFHRIVEILISGVNQMLLRQPTDVCNIPLAVVISKADALPKNDFPFLNDLYQSMLQKRNNKVHSKCRKVFE